MTGNSSYVVVWSGKAKESLIIFVRKMLRLGTSNVLVQAVKTLDRKLHRNPFDVGEPYRIKGIVEERTAVESFLAIDFAIDKARQLVLVRTCEALSGHGI